MTKTRKRRIDDMGWWSYHPMGGDRPLDIKDEFEGDYLEEFRAVYPEEDSNGLLDSISKSNKALVNKNGPDNTKMLTQALISGETSFKDLPKEFIDDLGDKYEKFIIDIIKKSPSSYQGLPNEY